MAMLEIKCPRTGKPVPTGIDASASAYPTLTIKNSRIGCPHCGGMHTWSKQDVINPPA